MAINRRPHKSLGLRLLEWIEDYPFLFWSGLWAITILISVGVTVLLLNLYFIQTLKPLPLPASLNASSSSEKVKVGPARPEARKLPGSEPPSIPANPPERNDPPKSPFPWWSLGVVFAVGCGTGGLWVKCQGAPRKRRDRQLRPGQSSLVPISQARSRRSLLRERRLRALRESRTVSFGPSRSQPLVTILPPEVVTPLDTPSASSNLAEQMDLRQRYSLSFILYHQKNYPVLPSSPQEYTRQLYSKEH